MTNSGKVASGKLCRESIRSDRGSVSEDVGGHEEEVSSQHSLRLAGGAGEQYRITAGLWKLSVKDTAFVQPSLNDDGSSHKHFESQLTVMFEQDPRGSSLSYGIIEELKETLASRARYRLYSFTTLTSSDIHRVYTQGLCIGAIWRF